MSSVKSLLILTVTCFVYMCSMIAPSAGLGGPCSQDVVGIRVESQDDILKRTSYPENQTVMLALTKDIVVDASITFSAAYACTIFTSIDPALAEGLADTFSISTAQIDMFGFGGARGSGFNVSTANDSFPAILVWNTSNILIRNVGFRLPVQTTYANCSLRLPQRDSENENCPSVSVFGSWGVQLVEGTMHGRVDILRTNQSIFDSLTVQTEQSNRAAVRLSTNGDGPALESSDIFITNCRIYGSFMGMLLYRQAVGVTIANNYFENNFFTAIQCGKNVHNAGDCMLTTILNNYVYVAPDFVTDPDHGSIYFGTHWINPGNYVSCNYAINGVSCLYLDWVSSGIVLEGGVCYNMTAGVKLNTSKNNVVTSFLFVEGRGQAGWISCQNYDLNNCLLDPGTYWEGERLRAYNSPEINQRYPYLTDFCNITAINNIPCNGPNDPPANVTGACSGLPAENYLRISVVDPQNSRRATPDYDANCEPLETVPRLNTISSDNYTSEEVQFIDQDNFDFGVLPTSAVYIDEPDFKSCPSWAVGVQPDPGFTYTVYFNSPREPNFFATRIVPLMPQL